MKDQWTKGQVAGVARTEASPTGMGDGADLLALCPKPGWGLTSTLQDAPQVKMALEGPSRRNERWNLVIGPWSPSS